MAYNCLLLDLDDTLLSFKASEDMAIRKVLEKNEIPTTQENIDTYKTVNDGLWSEFENGKIKKYIIEKIRFKKFGEAIGIDIKNSEQMNKEYIELLRDSAILMDGAIEFLEDIEEAATIAIVTNGIEAVQKNRIRLSGISAFTDGIFTSEKVGANKPNKQIFLAAIKSLGIENNQKVLVVGDRLNSDIKGGINAGLDTCWVNFDGIENDTIIKPKFEARDYTQLKNIILGE
ncbi:MAG: YjjG family noncanonical pyrimidine nucleotidase [Oscillospiraceae bacterium]